VARLHGRLFFQYNCFNIQPIEFKSTATENKSPQNSANFRRILWAFSIGKTLMHCDFRSFFNAF